MLRRITLIFISLLLSYGASAESDVAERRALFNYQMFCQGCHAIDGSGHKSVPELKNSMHRFMASQSGREYLVRVPGSANSTLDNEQLAELLNWMLVNFTAQNTTQDWRPYIASEVAEYRKSPLFETVNYRRALLASLNSEPGS